jgi:hypothetical protein
LVLLFLLSLGHVCSFGISTTDWPITQTLGQAQFIVTFFMVIFCIHFVFARDPVYTTERLDDGRMAIKCPTEDDALILINDYNLPDKFVLIVLLKGISFEEPELNKLLTEMKLYSSWEQS